MVHKCPVCGRKFASFEAYMEHRMLGLCGSSSHVLRCPKCGMRFTSLKKAFFHILWCGPNVVEELSPLGVIIHSREELRKALYTGKSLSPTRCPI